MKRFRLGLCVAALVAMTGVFTSGVAFAQDDGVRPPPSAQKAEPVPNGPQTAQKAKPVPNGPQTARQR